MTDSKCHCSVTIDHEHMRQRPNYSSVAGGSSWAPLESEAGAQRTAASLKDGFPSKQDLSVTLVKPFHVMYSRPKQTDFKKTAHTEKHKKPLP